MGARFAELMFTQGVREQQTLHGSRRQYQHVQEVGEAGDRLGQNEREFIAARDGFYMASVGETGWPYVQFRGGPKGFLHVLDERTLGYADLRGNKQYISVGNVLKDDRVTLFLMDYVRQQRLKILGRVRVLEGDEQAAEWMGKLRTEEKGAVPERALMIAVEAFDWNCPQHIPQRFTVEELRGLGLLDEAKLAQMQRTRGT